MESKSQREAVIEVMESKGGFVTLQNLYQEVTNIQGVNWNGTKDMQANIRCLLQRNKKDFFKIEPGLWGLNNYRNKLPNSIQKLIEEKSLDNFEKKNYTHSYYQGQIVDIGNMRGFKTCVPSQDKNKPYLNKTLKDLTTIDILPDFTYKTIIKRIKSIDVFWLEENDLPVNIFEIENSTDFRSALIKFFELKSFATDMCIVAPKERRTKFNETIEFSIFKELRSRVKFIEYEKVDNYLSSYNKV